MKILIADDDPIVRAVVARVVRQSSDDLIETENGLDALQAIERDDPDVLITDLQMPVLDGFELVQTVRASVRHRAMPIVCLSSVSDRDAIARLAEMGITDYVLKPIRPRDLAERLRMVVTKHGKWKLERDSSPSTATPAVLIIDPDAAFRSLVALALAPDFVVIEAPTGAAGVTAFRTRTPRIATVLISEGLQLLDEERVTGLLRRLAVDESATPPTVILVSASESVSSEKAAGFDGVIRRTLVSGDFLAAAARWLPKAADERPGAVPPVAPARPAAPAAPAEPTEPTEEPAT